MEEYIFTRGDVAESIFIMREAASWLANIGKPLWDVNMLSKEKLQQPAEDFVVMWNNQKSISTLLLSYEDKIFWPEVPKNSSGFIHKLSIKREFAGQNLGIKIIEFAIKECKLKGIKMLRLECDSQRRKLCNFYEGLGFNLKEIRRYENKKSETNVAYSELVIDLAYYEMII